MSIKDCIQPSGPSKTRKEAVNRLQTGELPLDGRNIPTVMTVGQPSDGNSLKPNGPDGHDGHDGQNPTQSSGWEMI